MKLSGYCHFYKRLLQDGTLPAVISLFADTVFIHPLLCRLPLEAMLALQDDIREKYIYDKCHLGENAKVLFEPEFQKWKDSIK